jgi:hypothetical protein
MRCRSIPDLGISLITGTCLRPLIVVMVADQRGLARGPQFVNADTSASLNTSPTRM